ncbi:hypothetical protein BB560_000559 [Smittium megazygosporum]|uniref:Sodium/calcium exchanger membrane region domain-containing protein n=1 Tax=Smittium megazygosporum TaxID=133381 RepID=A0A2T9ZK77_9FUNG|nr:hypothetical protein BB560_000559 [Smittium megazygosporum]
MRPNISSSFFSPVFIILLLSPLFLAASSPTSHISPLPGSNSSFSSSTALSVRSESVSCSDINNAENKCLFAIQNCQGNSDSIFNYFLYLYCAQSSRSIRIVSLFLELLFLFAWLGLTASDYFSPNLKTIAQIFRLPDSIAGVTLLAVGNGAPDLFTTYNAFKNDLASLALGQLVGGTFFIVCVVSSIVIIICKEISVPKQLLFREMLFLSISLIITCVVVFSKRIILPFSIVLISVYILFVTVIATGVLISKRFSFSSRAMVETRLRYDNSFENSLVRDYQQQKSPRESLPPNNRDSQLAPNHLNSLETHAQTHPYSLASAVEFSDFFNQMPSKTKHETANRESKPSTSKYPSPSTVEPVQFPGQSKLENLKANAEHGISLENPTMNSSLLSQGLEPTSNDIGIPADFTQIETHNKNQQNVPNILISSPSATSFSEDSPHYSVPAQSSNFSRQGHGLSTVPSRPLSRSRSRSHSFTPEHYDSIYWAIATKFIPILNRWKPTTSWYTKILLVIASPPVLLLTVSVPVIHDLPESFTERRRAHLGLDVVWDVLSHVSQNITNPDDISESPVVAHPSPDVSHQIELVPRSQSFNVFAQSAFPRSLKRTDTSSSESSVSSANLAVGSSTGMLHSPMPTQLIIETTQLSPQSEPISNTHNHQIRIPHSFYPEPSLNLPQPYPSSFDASFDYSKKAELLVSLARCILTPMFISLSLVHIAGLGRSTFIIGLCVGILASAFFLFANQVDLTISDSDNAFSQALKQLIMKFRLVIDSFPGFIGFVSGIFWINLISNEVVEILQTLGSVLKISNSLMGFTLLAFGNSIGDLATNITVARLGFPIMGISACFGGPLLNLSLGVGLSSLVKILSNRSSSSGLSPILIDVDGHSLVISAMALLIVICILFTISILQGFKLKSWNGYLLICIYFVVFGLNIYQEYKK